MIEIQKCEDTSSEDSTAIVFASVFLAYLVFDVIVCGVALSRKLTS
tara:strand:+ start:406 stop:543 length:138 start_codon:yes stop_codon:yes gene_type:complete